jgi:hypothetical protein
MILKVPPLDAYKIAVVNMLAMLIFQGSISLIEFYELKIRLIRAIR